MKIIYVANARIPTERAHGIQIMQMCEAFASLGHEVELLLPKRRNWIKDNPFSYYGVSKTFNVRKLACLDLIPFHKVIGHLGLWLETATFIFSAFPYLLFKKADLIYTRDKSFAFLVFLKRNFILEIHDFPGRYFLYSQFMRRLSGLVVITSHLKDRFKKEGIPEEKIMVAPDGVDLKRFDIKESMQDCRKKLGLPLDKKIVLYAGHFYQWKGVFVLADASSRLSGDVTVFFVGGTAEDVENFRDKNSGLKVGIVGHRPHQEIPYWLKAADVLVMPNSGKKDISWFWTSPLKMFEYMASRRPIVASDLPSIREILNEKNAFLVKPDDPEALASGISKVLGDYAFGEAIAERAFNDVQSFTWEKRAAKIIKGITGRV